MKWLIASDIHGSAKYCAELLKAFSREGADRLFLLGDILYHGPRNPLPEGYDPMRTAALLNGMKHRISCIRGNCDSEVDQMVLEFPIMAEYALIAEGETVIHAVHGLKLGEGELPKLGQGEVLLHGHTHIPECVYRNGVLFCDPGSVSLPKAGSERGYMTLEGGVLRWFTLGGTEYMSKRLGAEQEVISEGENDV